MILNVLNTLDTHVGPNYFHYMIPLLSKPDFILAPDAVEDA